MPDTAPPAQTVPADARQPNAPQYSPPFQQQPQESPPNGLVPSVLRESGSLLKLVSAIPIPMLAVISLVGMTATLLYAVVFLAPQLQFDAINQMNRSHEDQRELDRALYREEGERGRKSARERDKAVMEAINKLEANSQKRDDAVIGAVNRLDAAVSRWEKK